MSEEGEGVVVKRVDFAMKRTRKIIEGLKHVTTPYFQILDCHHNINRENLKKFIEKIDREGKSHVIRNSIFFEDVDSGEIFKDSDMNFPIYGSTAREMILKQKFDIAWVGAGYTTFNTDLCIRNLQDIKNDIVYFDDITFSAFSYIWSILENGFDNVKELRCDIPFYIRRYGRNISTTHFNEIDDNFKSDLVPLIETLLSNLEKIEECEFKKISVEHLTRFLFSIGVTLD